MALPSEGAGRLQIPSSLALAFPGTCQPTGAAFFFPVAGMSSWAAV